MNALHDLGEKQDVEKQQAAVKYNSNERPPVKEVTEQVKREPAADIQRKDSKLEKARLEKKLSKEKQRTPEPIKAVLEENKEASPEKSETPYAEEKLRSPSKSPSQTKSIGRSETNKLKNQARSRNESPQS